MSTQNLQHLFCVGNCTLLIVCFVVATRPVAFCIKFWNKGNILFSVGFTSHQIIRKESLFYPLSNKQICLADYLQRFLQPVRDLCKKYTWGTATNVVDSGLTVCPRNYYPGGSASMICLPNVSFVHFLANKSFKLCDISQGGVTTSLIS